MLAIAGPGPNQMDDTSARALCRDEDWRRWRRWRRKRCYPEHAVTTGEANEQHHRHHDRRHEKHEEQPLGHGVPSLTDFGRELTGYFGNRLF
jgi:hypothetical protein